MAQIPKCRVIFCVVLCYFFTLNVSNICRSWLYTSSKTIMHIYFSTITPRFHLKLVNPCHISFLFLLSYTSLQGISSNHFSSQNSQKLYRQHCLRKEKFSTVSPTQMCRSHYFMLSPTLLCQYHLLLLTLYKQKELFWSFFSSVGHKWCLSHLLKF